MYTKFWTCFNIVGLTIFSIILYVVAVWICNYIPSIFLSVYTAKAIFASSVSYLLWLLFAGGFLVIDMIHILYQKSWNTTLHHAFKSIQTQKEPLEAKEWYKLALKWWNTKENVRREEIRREETMKDNA